MLAKVARQDAPRQSSPRSSSRRKRYRMSCRSGWPGTGVRYLTDHRRFTLATDVDVYFCDPQSPWQCRSNENTNGLMRQYFPKGTDLSVHWQAHLNKIGASASTNGQRETVVQPKPRQRDLTLVLRRSVEPAVKSGHLQRKTTCPLCPRERTFSRVLACPPKADYPDRRLKPSGNVIRMLLCPSAGWREMWLSFPKIPSS